MDRDEISVIAHRAHPIAAPVSEWRMRDLLARLPDSDPSGSALAVDLGCGRARWLIALLRQREALRGIGVDRSAAALDAARSSLRGLGLSDRLELVHGDVIELEPMAADVAICVGATHAHGGLGPTLEALRRHLRPGGSAILGEGFWEREPTTAALDALESRPRDLLDLAGLVAHAEGAGFEVESGHVSTPEEWDDYEWSWTAGLLRWAAEQSDADAADREHARAEARQHRERWLRGYRGVLGFASLVLVDRT